MSVIIFGYGKIEAEVRDVKPWGICGLIGVVTRHGRDYEVAKLHHDDTWWCRGFNQMKAQEREDENREYGRY